MKNTILSIIAFVIVSLVAFVPASFADDHDSVTFNAGVNSGLAMDAGADPDEMTVDPIAMGGLDTDTAVTTLTINNNDPLGFNITAQLVASDTAGTFNTLAFEGGANPDIELATEGGEIGFASVETAGLTGGTDEVYGAFTTADQVYESGTGDDGQCADGTVVVTYTLSADEEVAPATYMGVVTYTIETL